MMKKIPFIIFTVVFLSCGSGGEPEFFSEDEIIEAADKSTFRLASEPSAQTPEVQMTKKVIKTGYLSFETRDIQEEYKRISSMLSGYSAYIENESQNTSDLRIDHNLTIRVPADHYDSLFEALAAPVDRVDSRSSNLSDVTERYYDLQTRLRNKEALEKRYLELLDQARAMTDILQIERNLNEVRTEIERLQGQFNYLSKQIGLSTISVYFYQELPYNYDPGTQRGFFARILQALDDGWQGFVDFGLGIIRLWPFVALIIAVIWLFRRYRRRRRKS